MPFDWDWRSRCRPASRNLCGPAPAIARCWPVANQLFPPSPPGFAGGEGRVRGDWSSHVHNPPLPALSPAKPGERVRKSLGQLPRESALLAIIVVLMVALELKTGHFFTVANIGDLATAAVLLGCVAAGAALVM